MTSSPVDVSKLEAAEGSATPGPWSWQPYGDGGATLAYDPGNGVHETNVLKTVDDWPPRDADAELIVLMRSAAPAFVALVRAVEALADEYESKAEACRRAARKYDQPIGLIYDAEAKAEAYGASATRLRAAVGAALNPQETER